MISHGKTKIILCKYDIPSGQGRKGCRCACKIPKKFLTPDTYLVNLTRFPNLAMRGQSALNTPDEVLKAEMTGTDGTETNMVYGEALIVLELIRSYWLVLPEISMPLIVQKFYTSIKCRNKTGKMCMRKPAAHAEAQSSRILQRGYIPSERWLGKISHVFTPL